MVAPQSNKPAPIETRWEKLLGDEVGELLLAAAMEDTIVSGAPSIAAAHIDVGLLNMGSASHNNAKRDEYPVMMSGKCEPREFA